MRRPAILAFAVIALISVQPSLHAPRSMQHATRNTQHATRITQHTQASDAELAATYAPLLYFHENERYRPQPIEVMLDRARLRQTIAGVEATIMDTITAGDLADAPPDSYIDLWYGQDYTSGYLNYTAHGSVYDRDGLRDNYSITTYARIYRAPDGRIAIQYWLFTYYNDWYNKHEGDWEMIQVDLDAAGQPVQAVYAQHHGGTRRPWGAVGRIDGTHPRAYVAQGSHATYFAGDAVYPQGADIGNQRVEVYDRTGSVGPVTPAVQLISESETPWLRFAGNWGERAFGDLSGPTGPASKGVQWSDPFAWAENQPSDAGIWYHHNVRAEADELPDAAALTLSNAPDAQAIVEPDRSRQTIIVVDPPDDATRYDLALQAHAPLSPVRMIIEWPDIARGLVFRRTYALDMPAGARVTTSLCNTCDFILNVDTDDDGAPERRVPSAPPRSRQVDFNPRESVLFYLPPEQIAAGVLLALLGAVLPTVVYAGGVTWLDRHEKEPAHLLRAAFLWGALPGAIVALVARFFVAGLLAPVITESLKFAAIAFIFTLYRREFDSVLDGIVYGALAGIGFAMTINFLTYATGFLFGGFELLGTSVLVNGVAFGLNEAYYGAVIGIGFGVSRWAKDRRLRVGAPFIGLAVAIGLHLFNDYWRDLAVGERSWLAIIPFIATWAGIVAVVAIALLSLRRDQGIIRAYLKAEFDLRTLTPNEYFYLSTPRNRSRLLLNAARRGPAELARALQMRETITQLAYRRRELEMLGRDAASDAVAAGLRQRIAGLRPKPSRRENR
jgi:RsiW-degrading membrane proteinase PrsW (M82 family)